MRDYFAFVVSVGILLLSPGILVVSDIVLLVSTITLLVSAGVMVLSVEADCPEPLQAAKARETATAIITIIFFMRIAFCLVKSKGRFSSGQFF